MSKFKTTIHQWSWLVLLAYLVAGLFYPVIGAAALICMIAPVMTAFFKGRMWCGYFCPRGSFNDIILGKITRRVKLPAFFRTLWFRLLFLGVLMGGFTVQIIMAWGNPAMIGQVFIRMIFITTLLTILLGIFYRPRAWCLICPMGTMAHFAAKIETGKIKNKHIFFQKEKCVNCRLCSRQCPILIDVHQYKEAGKMDHADCLKCLTCVAKCPKKSLHIA